MENAIEFIFQVIILIFSVTIHEVSHGYTALALGDRTAHYAGRLTLNPLKHLEFFGSVLLPFLSYAMTGFIFGWAKPVPYNPYNLKNQKWGPAFVALAGPVSNMTLALVFGSLLRLVFILPIQPSLFTFNFTSIISFVVMINLVLAFFNLVPIPPLDGSKILFAVLPYQWERLRWFLEQYGFFILVLFIYLFSGLLIPLALFVFKLITGIAPFQ